MGYVALTAADFAPNKPARATSFALQVHYNLVALKELPKGLSFGGDPGTAYENTSYASIVFPVYREIDGTNLGGLIFEVHCMGRVTAADTGYVQLWDRTAAAQIVEVTFANTALARVVSATFSLPAAVREFEIRTKAAIGGAASPYNAYGFIVMQR